MNNTYPGRQPAIVKSYDPARRTCRVEIPGITDGGEVLPEAEIEYPPGDRSKAGAAHPTEIEMLPGDMVWVDFIGGDPRYPIITGGRNAQAGNAVGTRRLHHANMALAADGTLTVTAANIVFTGNAQFGGGGLTHNGKNVGGDHAHGGVQPGSGNSGPPT